MKKTKNNNDDEGYYAISVFIAVVLTVLIHYFLLADINIHPTIHVVIGIFIFCLFTSLISPLLAKYWDKL